MPLEQRENFLITYGCKPTGGVEVKSTIAVNYFAYLKQNSKPIQENDDRRFLVLP